MPADDHRSESIISDPKRRMKHKRKKMLTDQHQVLTLVKTFDKLRPYMGHRSFDFSKVLNNELLNLKKSNQMVND